MNKILILDDEIGVRFSLENHFEDCNFDVYVAQTAEEAIELIKTICVNIAIVDLRLPEKSGVDFIEESLNLCKNIIYLIHSGYIHFKFPQHFKENSYISPIIFQKPLLNLFDLNKEIERMLKENVNA